MKIGIDIRPLEGSAYGGVAEYVKNLLPELFKLAPQHTFYLFCNSYKHEADLELFKYPNVEIREFKYPSKVFNFLCVYFNFPKLDTMLGGLDVLFSPHFFPAPVSEKCSRVTTFHDISFELFPEFFNARRRYWHRYVNPRKQAKKSDAIIAVSQSTKKDLERLYGISQSNISVIYSGVSLPSNKKKRWNGIRRKYKLPNEYILSLNTIEPRKNMASAVVAFNALASKKKNTNLNLVIAGNLGWSYKSVLEEIKKSPYRSRIFIIGPVLEEEKSLIYKNARVFIYPSLYEGFGLPPLEAMSEGVPTIVSFSTSLPEVTGGAALMVDPTKPIEIANAVQEILDDDHLALYLSEEGKKQADKFKWEKAARKTLEVLERIPQK